MMFMEPHIAGVIDALTARRDHCDAMICCMSAGEVMKLTRMGRFSMDGEQGGAMSLLKRLRGKSTTGGKPKNVGAQQLSVLRRLPRNFTIHPGYGSRLASLFPDSAVLAGRIRREFVANDSAGCAALCRRAQRSIAQTARA
jgi:magnesium chelatase subunit H